MAYKQKTGEAVTGYALRIIGFGMIAVATPILFVLPFGTLMGALILFGGIRVAHRGREILQVDGETLLSHDSREPVLYLRDFRNAETDIARWKGITTTDEERLAAVMNQVGPFIGLGESKRHGRTGFGAARIYLGNEWQEKIIELLRKAQLVVIRIDPLKEDWGLFYRDTLQHDLIQKSSFKLKEDTRPSDFLPRKVGLWLWWELSQVKDLVKPERTLLYLPFKPKESDREELYQDVRGFIEQSLDQKLPPRLGKAKFIGFETDGRAYLMNSSAPPTLGIVNFYGTTLKPFFEQAGTNSVSGFTVHFFRIVELLFGIFIILSASIIGGFISWKILTALIQIFLYYK